MDSIHAALHPGPTVNRTTPPNKKKENARENIEKEKEKEKEKGVKIRSTPPNKKESPCVDV